MKRRETRVWNVLCRGGCALVFVMAGACGGDEASSPEDANIAAPAEDTRADLDGTEPLTDEVVERFLAATSGLAEMGARVEEGNGIADALLLGAEAQSVVSEHGFSLIGYQKVSARVYGALAAEQMMGQQGELAQARAKMESMRGQLPAEQFDAMQQALTQLDGAEGLLPGASAEDIAVVSRHRDRFDALGRSGRERTRSAAAARSAADVEPSTTATEVGTESSWKAEPEQPDPSFEGIPLVVPPGPVAHGVLDDVPLGDEKLPAPPVSGKTFTISIGPDRGDFTATRCVLTPYRTGNLIVLADVTALGTFRGKPVVALLSSSRSPHGDRFERIHFYQAAIPEVESRMPFWHLNARWTTRRTNESNEVLRPIQERQKQLDYDGMTPDEMTQQLEASAREFDAAQDSLAQKQPHEGRSFGRVWVEGERVRFRGDAIRATSRVGSGGENPFAGYAGETRATVDCSRD